MADLEEVREGISRRELMKRGAIVGGTVLWAAPVIQSLSTPAMAQQSPCGCCYCFDDVVNSGDDDECSDDGRSGERATPGACAAFCAAEGFENSEFCSGTAGGCTCTQFTLAGPNDNLGCDCIDE